MPYSRWSTEGVQDRNNQTHLQAQVIIVWPEARVGNWYKMFDSFSVSQALQEVSITIVVRVLTHT
jgi:hypothetical protein